MRHLLCFAGFNGDVVTGHFRGYFVPRKLRFLTSVAPFSEFLTHQFSRFVVVV